MRLKSERSVAEVRWVANEIKSSMQEKDFICLALKSADSVSTMNCKVNGNEVIKC